MIAGLSAVGCTMCPDPFDYSGPVPNGSAPQNDFRARSGGIMPLGATPRPWPRVVRAEGDSEGVEDGGEGTAPIVAEESEAGELQQTAALVAESLPDSWPESEPEPVLVEAVELESATAAAELEPVPAMPVTGNPLPHSGSPVAGEAASVEPPAASPQPATAPPLPSGETPGWRPRR